MKNIYRSIGMWLIIISLGICLGCAQAIDDSEKKCTGNSCNENPDQIDTDGDGVLDIDDCAPTDPDRFNEVAYWVDKNENNLPVATPGNPDGISFTMCVGYTVQDYPCFTRNSGPWDTAEIPTARCGGNQPLPTGSLACVANGNTVTLTVNNVTGIVTNVNFMEGVNTVGSDNTEPYSLVLSNVNEGNHVYFGTLIGPNGNANTNSCSVTAGGNVGNPVVTIVVPVSGANETINVSFTTLATVDYAYPINNLTFTVGNNTTPTCTDATAPYECVITPTALGNLTVTVTAHAANGHTGSASVTVNVVNATIRPLIRFVYGWGRNIYHGMTSDCIQGRGWNFTEDQYKTCGANGNLCVIQGDMSDYAIAGGRCEWNYTAPSGGGGNPIPSFPDGCDFSLTGIINPDDGTVTYDDELTSQTVYISDDNGITWIETPDTYIMHSWGANYVMFNETDPQDDEYINVIIGTAIDSDGDGYLNACPADTSCVPDNCILYINPTQVDTDNDGIGDACVNHPSWCENDSNNDGRLDGEGNPDCGM